MNFSSVLPPHFFHTIYYREEDGGATRRGIDDYTVFSSLFIREKTEADIYSW
jgi:hypothetical protein